MKSLLFIIRQMFCDQSIDTTWLQDLVRNHYSLVQEYYDTNHRMVEESQIVDATIEYGIIFEPAMEYSILITFHYDKFVEKNITPFFPDEHENPITVVIPYSNSGVYKFFKDYLDEMLKVRKRIDVQFDFGFDLSYQNLKIRDMLNRYSVEHNPGNPDYHVMKNLIQDMVNEYNSLTCKIPVEYLRNTLTNITINQYGIDKTLTVILTCFPPNDCEDADTMECEQTSFTHLGEIDMWIGVPNAVLSLMAKVPFSCYLDFS